MIPSACYSFHLISFTRISRGPSHHKKWILKQQVPLKSTQHPKAQHENQLPMDEPLPSPRQITPKTTRKPFRGHGCLCGPRPPWPPQRSAARPRRHGLPEPPDAAASRLGRRGDADGGAAAGAVEKQSVAMGCFSRWLGKILNIGHKYHIRQADTFCMF